MSSAFNRSRTAIFDMDGTLCNISHILHLLKDQQFHDFVMATAECDPNLKVVKLLKVLREAGFCILIVTARSKRYEALTVAWLDKFGIEYDGLFMRADDDDRPDKEVKSDILDHLISEGYVILVAVDDNPTIIELWGEREIHSHVVPGWIPGESPDDFDASHAPYLSVSYTS